MTLWRCLLTTSTNSPDMTNKIKPKDLNMGSVFAWGQVSVNVKSLLCRTFSLTFSWSLKLLWGTMVSLFAPFPSSGEVWFLNCNQPISPNLSFPVFSQNKPSNGNTLLYNHVLASQLVLTGPVNCVQLHCRMAWQSLNYIFLEFVFKPI